MAEMRPSRSCCPAVITGGVGRGESTAMLKRTRAGESQRDEAVAQALAVLKRRAADIVAELDSLEQDEAMILADREKIQAQLRLLGVDDSNTASDTLPRR
jgi:hypothetical protein